MSAKKKPTGKSSKISKASQTRSKASKKSGALRVGSALLDQLVQEAKAVRERAYAPYSKYPVGAAIATKSGSIYVGCNVENSSFGGTICAERGAIMAMVAPSSPATKAPRRAASAGKCSPSSRPTCRWCWSASARAKARPGASCSSRIFCRWRSG